MGTVELHTCKGIQSGQPKDGNITTWFGSWRRPLSISTGARCWFPYCVHLCKCSPLGQYQYVCASYEYCARGLCIPGKQDTQVAAVCTDLALSSRYSSVLTSTLAWACLFQTIRKSLSSKLHAFSFTCLLIRQSSVWRLLDDLQTSHQLQEAIHFVWLPGELRIAPRLC